MKLNSKLALGLLSSALCVNLSATERYFGYSYEPETMPAGALEFEQAISLRTQRAKNLGQDNYNKWEIREELEYGVTDRYTIALYLNTESESFRDSSRADQSSFNFRGVSIENRYMVWNPAEHAVGLTLYLEPRFSGDEAELEQRIIIGQRFSEDWKWALNLVHETEWENNLHDTEGEIEGTFGISRDFTKRFSAGLEARSVSAIPEYRDFEYTALFVGPVISYHQDKWWASLTVLPQVFGRNFNGDPDNHRNLVLDEQERINIRLLFGINF